MSPAPGRRVKFRKDIQWLFIKCVVVFCLILGIFLFLKGRKEALLKAGTHFLETLASRGTDLDVKIGKISGHFLGSVRFQDVEVTEPWLPAEQATVFKAKAIQFRCRFLDFLSKNFDSKIELIVEKPEVHWRPRLSLKKPHFPFMDWMKRWALSQKERVVIVVKDMTFVFGYEKRMLKGIDIFFQNNSFKIEVPVSHITVGKSDVTSVVNVQGRFRPSRHGQADALVGHIHTEGTVIDWKPLPQESKFDFVFSEEDFRLVSSDFLGGIEITGRIDFLRDYNIDFTFQALNYPMANLGPFFGSASPVGLQGRMDLDVHFYGSPWAPHVEARTRIYRDWVTSRKEFKAMDLTMSGVYPTVRLEGSRMLMEDGSTMRLADKTLEIGELFSEDTYETLVGEAQQDTVVWGDWEFSRSRDVKDRPEFSMERVMGDEARVHLREVSQYNEVFDSDETRQMEVGFEYRLKSRDSLRLELREGEEFVGVERKVKF